MWHSNIIEASRLYMRLIKTNMQIVRGMWKISKIPQPRITIFGGHLLPLNNNYLLQAHDLAQQCISANISVITGGGPGVMQAATCGAFHDFKKNKKIRSIGISVKGLEEEGFNYCTQERLVVNYFYARKWLMMNYSDAFIIFPGGFGTLDELCEALMLMQTKILKKQLVIVIGKEYWKPIQQWLYENAVQQDLILKENLAMLTITDDIQEVFMLVKEHCDQIKNKVKI